MWSSSKTMIDGERGQWAGREVIIVTISITDGEIGRGCGF